MTAPELTPEHREAIEKTANLLRLFLATRPIAEVRMLGKGIKCLALTDPAGMAHGWVIGVRKRRLDVMMASMDFGNGGS